LVTSGLERTENNAKEKAATKTSNGPRIEPAEFKLRSGTNITIVPATPITSASASLRPSFSFNKTAENTAMRTGPIATKNPASPEETVVSPKFSAKWYAGTFRREIARSLGKSRLSNFTLDFRRKGETARNPADARSHLSRARLIGESSKSALLMATNANPQIRLRPKRTTYALACCHKLPWLVGVWGIDTSGDFAALRISPRIT
jgi:hypothetical protein